MRSLAIVPGIFCVLTACGGGSSASTAPPPTADARIDSTALAGDVGMLAGELLLNGRAQPESLQPLTPLADGALDQRLTGIAIDHLRSELGAGNGPSLQGSARIRRLAQDPSAPPDSNQNGRNWDETLQVELQRLGTFAGGPLPVGGAPTLFPWRLGTVELAAPLPAGPKPDPAHWRTRRVHDGSLRMLDIGASMRARALLGGRLLQQGRGALAGASTDDGQLGLVSLEQTLAAEETLLASLFTDGGQLTGIPDPAHYDPLQGTLWLPAELAVQLDPAASDVVLGYRVRDNASDLEALAAVLDASCELFWLARDQQSLPALHAVFRGSPFEPLQPSGPPPHVLNWNDDIYPLLSFRCGGCHLGYPTGGWMMDTLQLALDGSPRTRSLGYPMVTPGNHVQSMLWTILVGPPAPILRMPYFSSQIPANEIQRIADWIDGGAPETGGAPPSPPQRGADLARVLFLDLAAMHLDPGTGGLHHRVEQDGASGIATAVSTGRALQALARLHAVLPTLAYQGQTVEDVLAGVAHFAATRLLAANGGARDAAGIAGPDGVQGGLAAQAALAAGLLAAREELPLDAVVAAAAQSALQELLRWRQAGDGTFGGDATHRGARYTPGVIADLLAALRLAAQADGNAAAARGQFLATLAPRLAHAEWDGRGEVLGDGVADTDHNGVPEPALAGGAFGRLPLLAAAIAVGDDAAQPPASDQVTWSQHVRPLLLAKCGQCHLAGAQQGDYRLDSVTLAGTAGVSHGALPLLVPGDPEHSFLYRKLVDRLPALGQQMPLSGLLLDDRGRELVRLWILQGATRR